MRRREQLPLTPQPIHHSHAAELEQISQILDANPRMAKWITQDLLRGVENPDTGAPGLSGDQVLRILIVKQMNGFSYEELAFHLSDSVTYRSFCRFGALERTPSRSTLAENLKKVGPKTLEKVLRRLVRYAVDLGVEKGRRVRIDATVTETNIHAPTDSSLLDDGVRVLTRLLRQATKHFSLGPYSDHTQRARRRAFNVKYTGNARTRRWAYGDLLKITKKTVGYAEHAVEALRAVVGPRGPFALGLAEELCRTVHLVRRVMDQTERRVFHGEAVPASDKIVSLFEPHTDIVVKERYETLYGHKVYLTGGASGLILDCVVAEGNPADSSMTLPLLKRQRRILGKVPAQAAFDGAFASKENLKEAQELGVQDVAFSKKRGLEVSEMTRSTWVYRKLRNFRAGIEGLISFLKRVFGLDRCTWSGAESFASYVLASVLAANVLTLARHLLS
jgi:IS5 family transposase